MACDASQLSGEETFDSQGGGGKITSCTGKHGYDAGPQRKKARSASDRRLYGNLVAAGFAVAVVWEDDLWSNTSDVVRVVDAARRVARAGAPAVFHTASCPWPEDCRDPLW